MSEPRRAFYMHTLDGHPAGFDPGYRGWAPYIYFAIQGRPVPLASSLRQIRSEQKKAMRAAAEEGGNQAEWASAKRYGYMRVLPPEDQEPAR